MARSIKYAGLIGRHVTMHLEGAYDSNEWGDVIEVRDLDDGTAVMIVFAGGRHVDIKTEDADRWRISIEAQR